MEQNKVKKVEENDTNTDTNVDTNNSNNSSNNNSNNSVDKTVEKVSTENEDLKNQVKELQLAKENEELKKQLETLQTENLNKSLKFLNEEQKTAFDNLDISNKDKIAVAKFLKSFEKLNHKGVSSIVEVNENKPTNNSSNEDKKPKGWKDVFKAFEQ